MCYFTIRIVVNVAPISHDKSVHVLTGKVRKFENVDQFYPGIGLRTVS